MPLKLFGLQKHSFHITDAHKTRLILLGIGLLVLPALLTNLGLVAFYGDEGIRALVALEMDISGNYIAPTLFGKPYFNKPPLYNWVLLAFFKLTGRNDEFAARLPTVLFLLAFAATVFFVLQKRPAPHPSPLAPPILVPLALVTCGRILFWDSMLALIDLSFSWAMYGLFMVIFTYGEKKQPVKMFVAAYLLAAVGFLLKGLPAVVFLGLALATYVFWQKKWRWLVSWAHLAGIVSGVAVAGSYYACYAQQHGLAQVAQTLFSESAKRTFVEHGAGKTLLHLLSFPFELWYHFLPWTLLAVYFFKKNSWLLIRQNRFVSWNLLVLAVTILPYWAAVEVYPRYVFMHVPLVYTALFFLHAEHKKSNGRLCRYVETALLVLCLLALAGSLAVLFWPTAKAVVPNLPVKAAAAAAALAVLTACYWRWKPQRLLCFGAVMLVARLAFDWFVLPTRIGVECSTKVRATTLAAAKKLEGRPLRIYQGDLGWQPVTGYYFTRETGQILSETHENFRKDHFYLLNPKGHGPATVKSELARVTVLWECGEMVVAKVAD